MRRESKPSNAFMNFALTGWATTDRYRHNPSGVQQPRRPATVGAVRADGRCSYALQQGSPATTTLPDKPGSRQAWNGVRCIHGAAVASAATAPTSGSTRRGRGSRAGTAWYCRQGQQTFSLLPDCPAARWPGTLVEFEAAVNDIDAARSLETAAATRRPEIELPGVLRWLRRRRQAMTRLLVILRGLLPAMFTTCAPTPIAFRQHLDVEWVLPVLRELAAEYLHQLPPPPGFSPRPRRGGEPPRRHQHRVGPDPPPRAS